MLLVRPIETRPASQARDQNMLKHNQKGQRDAGEPRRLGVVALRIENHLRGRAPDRCECIWATLIGPLVGGDAKRSCRPRKA
jgi:hypothetical protein